MSIVEKNELTLQNLCEVFFVFCCHYNSAIPRSSWVASKGITTSCFKKDDHDPVVAFLQTLSLRFGVLTRQGNVVWW